MKLTVQNRINEIGEIPKSYSISKERRESILAEWDGYSKRTAIIIGTQSNEFLNTVKQIDLKLYHDLLAELHDLNETDND